jgi:hypothetical protein
MADYSGVAAEIARMIKRMIERMIEGMTGIPISI